MKVRLALLATLLVACTGDDTPDDVVGPFTGEMHRYVVDSFILPHDPAEARALGSDLTGNKIIENQFGSLVAQLSSYDDVSLHAVDMIAAGTIASSVEIVADDLATDESVSVLYLGADGAPATHVGGTFEDGIFISNRTRDTNAPGSAELYVPVYQDADPSVLPLIGMEMQLVPDGAGGFDAIIRGGIPGSAALDVAAAGMAEMVASNPGGHRGMIDAFDAEPRDGVVTQDEVATNTLMMSLCYPDVTVPSANGRQLSLSTALGVHLRPCETGNCNLAAPSDHCFDRTVDSDETDVDCGGSCGSCKGGASCTAPTDCETGVCSNGTCGPPSCTDGLRDGAEQGVDCGKACRNLCR